MAAGVAVSGLAVSVSAWSAWAILAQAGKAGHSSLPVGTLGENSGASGRNMNGRMDWQRIRADSWASSIFRFTLVMSLKSVGDRGLPPCGGVQVGPLLQQFSDGQPLMQVRLVAWHRHALDCTYFTPVWYLDEFHLLLVLRKFLYSWQSRYQYTLKKKIIFDGFLIKY